ncbi:MAG TPA: DinB family protein [Bryobacteraceae bacterium]|nr:DinB family protein [Bryobacteraceae bacterium]
MKISESLLPEFDQEMANTRKVLERVPAAKFSWKPHAKSFEFGGLAAHIANMADWAELTLTSDSFDYAPPGAAPYETPKYTSTEDLVSAFDKSVAKARVALAAADDAKMMAPWSLMAGGRIMMTMPRVAVIRSFVMNHTIHHRAQLTVYLRMNEIPVPALYGPSADEQ